MKKAQNGIRIREDVWGLPRWDDTLLWYARAIARMWERPLADPTSWRYQAAIHGYDANFRLLKAIAKPGEQVPAKADEVWRQCQHFGWFFIPWHRGYLGCFEAIVRETIAELGGPADDWALPYWDYSDGANPNARLARPEFVELDWPGVGDNPLSAGIERAPHSKVATALGQAGDFGIDPEEVSLAALDQPEFTASPNASSFGGAATGFSHNQGSRPGSLEGTPHADIHNAVGYDEATGTLYWMGAFETAGLDPLFWLHHCNLDRLWDEWKRKAASTGNPPDQAWLQPRSAVTGERMPFILHLPGKPNFSFVPEEVVDTARSEFSYVYDRHPQATPLKSLSDSLLMGEAVAMRRPEPQILGATDAPTLLEGGRAVASVSIAHPTKALLSTLTEARRIAPPRLFLNVENIVSTSSATPYRVYLNVPDDFDPAEYRDHFVGTLPMFGIREATQSSGEHGGSGLSYTFDITGVAGRVGGEDGALRVAFVAKRGARGTPGLKVGKVSVYQG